MFEVGERVICIDDSKSLGALVKGRSYIVRSFVPAGTVVAVRGEAKATAMEDGVGVGAAIDLRSLLASLGFPGFTVLVADFWAVHRFRRPLRPETRTALAELIGLADTARETVDA